MRAGDSVSRVEHRFDDASAAAAGDELAQLVYLSHVVGADPTLTQPGGGNTSVKRLERDRAGREALVLRVKGSGTDLARIGPAGFCGLRLGDLERLRRHDRMSDEEMMAFLAASMLDPTEPAPSVETPLHAILPHRFVAHTHDLATQALTDTARPEALVREALGAEAAYLDYVRPGFPLARAVMELGPLGAGVRGLVLGRHGLVAWGETARACYDNLHRLIQAAERYLASRRGRRPFGEIRFPAPDPARRRAAARAILPHVRAALSPERPLILHYDDADEVLAFVGSERAGALAARGMATPEHILRCGRLPLYVEADLAALPLDGAVRALREACARYAAEARAAFARSGLAGPMLEPVPKVALLPGLGLVTAMKDTAGARVGNACYRHVLRVMEAAEALGGFRFLDEADALEFEYWPLERRKLAQPERELSRQVALVTGAASGIGRAIAERFAAEGAHLVLTDVAAGALREAADAVARACGDPHRVRALEGDAARAADVAAAVDEAVLGFGGLDVLVCNAGFVESGPIEGVSEESWQRHFDLHAKAAYLAVREAVPAMKAQRRGAIVFNASKGAFAPTVDNAAYASSKAAVAALARNLAAELGPFGIRVNCFNADFVDTPLMARLVAQRAARAGISVDEQTAAYRARNRLGVGPIPPAAVAEVALFLASARSRYTTGAAIPVDGGVPEAMPR